MGRFPPLQFWRPRCIYMHLRSDGEEPAAPSNGREGQIPGLSERPAGAAREVENSSTRRARKPRASGRGKGLCPLETASNSSLKSRAFPEGIRREETVLIACALR